MDFNPDFHFNVLGADGDVAHPWSFKGASAQAQSRTPGQTTVDEKIRSKRGLANTAHSKPTRSAKVPIKKPFKAANPDEDNKSDSDISSAPDNSEDRPLPGEDMSEDSAEIGSQSLPAKDSSRPPKTQKPALRALAEPRSSEPEDSDNDNSSSSNYSEPAELTSAEGPPETKKPLRKASAERLSRHMSAIEAAKPVREERAKQKKPLSERASTHKTAEASGRSEKQLAANKAGPQQMQAGFFASTPAGTSFTATSFAELGLSRPLVKACAALGYTTPTPIQAACIPLILMGRDVVGSAITGSGKTAAFVLPLLERLLHRSRRIAATHVLILAPVRELAMQVHSMLGRLAQFTDVRAALVVGGLAVKSQEAELRAAPDVVVATPGRIIDHVMNTMAFELDSLSALVLDEADRLLEMGFQDEIKHIVSLAPRKRQTLLFSATMTEKVQQLITLSLQSPVRLAADRAVAAPSTLRQEILRLKGSAASDKIAVLLALCKRSLAESRTIIFCGQKWQAHRLKILMGLAGLPHAGELHGDLTQKGRAHRLEILTVLAGLHHASDLHGGLTQAARLEALELFATGEARFLLATDVAARGLDILGVETVVNFDCPQSVETYLHRVGRTARAGASGLAITFVEDGDRAVLKAVVKQVKAKLASRMVPKAVVESWRAKMEALQPQIDEIVKEEREEKALRKAEMEATKAANLINHEAEILTRPKRAWFLTARQKAEIVEASKQAVGLPEPQKDEDAERRAAKAAKHKRNAEAKGLKHQSNSAAETGSGHVAETKAHMGTVKAAKAAARHMREGGQRPKAASAAALQAVGVKKQQKHGVAKRGRHESIDDDDASEGPEAKLACLAATTSRVYAGGGKSTKVRKPPSGPTKQQKARLARGGKGKAQFKGKAKFKRR